MCRINESNPEHHEGQARNYTWYIAGEIRL